MRKSTLAILTGFSMFAAACGADATPQQLAVSGDSGQPTSSSKGDSSVPQLRQCFSSAQNFTTSNHWGHLGSWVIAKLGDPHHRIQDVIGTPSSVVTVRGRYTYGLDKAMEKEKSSLYFDNCATNVKVLDQNTDGDGGVAYVIRLPATPGVYAIYGVMNGDGSTASAYAWVLPKGSHLAISDIDGTLTTSDSEVIKQAADSLIDGSYTPEAYPAATDLTWAEAGLNRIPVYLTGRPSLLKDATTTWLNDQGFAWGPVHVTDTTQQALPGNSGVGEFKRVFLQNLVTAGFKLDIAFGNATTDVYAYSKVGIPVASQYIIGSNAGYEGTNGVTDSWQSVSDAQGAADPVSQPFTW